MMDDDGQVFVFKMLVEKVAQLGLGSDEMDPHRKSAAGENSAADLRLGSIVGTHGVERDVDERI